MPKEHNRLTLELVNFNYINENDSQIFYYDNFFEKLLKNNSYKDLITIIHYIVPRVISKSFCDEEGNPIDNKYGYFKISMINNINRLKLNSNNLWEEIDFII